MIVMDKEEAIELVAKIIFDRACTFLVEGNPAFDSERCLLHIGLVMSEWGYSCPKLNEYYDSLKYENDLMREMGMNDD